MLQVLRTPKQWQGLSLTSGVLQEPTSPVTPQMLAAAQLHAEYVIHEYHALQKRAHIEQEQFNDKINKLHKGGAAEGSGGAGGGKMPSDLGLSWPLLLCAANCCCICIWLCNNSCDFMC